MASLIYKDFLVVASATPDTSEWIPVASVHWTNSHGRTASHYFTNVNKQFRNRNDAINFAIQTAQQWIDNRLANYPGRASQ